MDRSTIRRRTSGLSTLKAESPAPALSRAELVRQRRALETDKRPRKPATRRYEKAAPIRRQAMAMPALPEVALSARWASLPIALLCGALFLHLLSSPAYRVDGLDLIGATRIPGEEILIAAGTQNLPAVQIDPQAVAARVEAVSGVRDAVVSVDWPARLIVVIEEQVPVIAWQQAGITLWVDQSGRMFEARDGAPGLLPIILDDAQPLEGNVPLDVVLGALQLKELRPNIEALHYDRVHGLSYQDGRGWRGYFGTGLTMDVKLKVYETLVDDLLRRQIRPRVVSVEDVDAAYYSR